jgi:hypothetical protein
MDSTALLELFRSDVRDQADPPLWSDVEVFSYMDDAQKMFCRLQGGIADASSAITRLTVPAGTVFVALSPRILKVREAHLDDGRGLELLNFEDLQTRGSGDDYGFRSVGYTLDMSTGPVRAMVLGIEANRARLLRIPETQTTISLIVYRMPLETIEEADQPLEIDEQHHRHLLLWMKHLAHLKQDAETYDRGRSEQFRAEFLAYCDQAKAERERREHKYRSIMYGGIA